MNLGFIQKKFFGWPQFGPLAKQGLWGLRGPAERVWAWEKNPINNWTGSESWVQTRGSDLGM